MPRTAPIPSIQCYSYHPFQDSLATKSRHSELGNTDYFKAQLRNRLNSCKLPNMPVGFPFSHVHDGYGFSRLSYDSYEFHEDLTSHSHRSQSRHHPQATIAFKNTSSRDKVSYLTWQIYLPSPDAAYLRHLQNRQAVAHVQVDPAVTRTPFWKSLLNDPSVILRALGLSLELGALLTIHPSRSRPGEIVYTITHKDGRQEPYFIVRYPQTDRI
ncbi:hypothetical protein LshimejAT787_2001200 [Lyophyllum shimeji]|uniref:Uncharacterized protein n=1 Tax=Lyophyllum shimeji TaxID=47721 RepID=A0A9P3Q072_LYOSH|nr:hypothetical protein LshimejAT787_2001200 [Lyophyllum shimeji]